MQIEGTKEDECVAMNLEASLQLPARFAISSHLSIRQADQQSDSPDPQSAVDTFNQTFLCGLRPTSIVVDIKQS
jgi:hypothetical protein